MADLVDRQALHYELTVEMVKCARMSEETKWTMAERVLNRLDEAPTIDPSSLRPKGEWVKDEEKDMKHCSGCGYRVYFTHNFCPSCGADTRREHEAV